MVSGFVHRIYRACSSWLLFPEFLEKAKCVLERNQYLPTFYEPIIKQTLDSPSVTTEVQYRGNSAPQCLRCSEMALCTKLHVRDVSIRQTCIYKVASRNIPGTRAPWHNILRTVILPYRKMMWAFSNKQQREKATCWPEAIHIQELKPHINTKDELRRTLTTKL